ncbi:MAG: bacterioferritin-associated ferredoxin [Ralstonia sp.]|nr:MULTISPECIES: bacterioferritin-associated ferredoxin [Ralstonia]UCA15600.1 bacterioferritin-associated ferredoxin [Ralstonia pickettii]
MGSNKNCSHFDSLLFWVDSAFRALRRKPVYVCICNQVTDREIHGAARLGVASMDELAETLGVGTCCGQCRDCAKQVLAEAVSCIPVDQTLGRASTHAIIERRDEPVANDQAIVAGALAA